MTAHVEPDAASPCFSGRHWPERHQRLASLTCVDNSDGTVTATAQPSGDGDPYTKTVDIDQQTQVKQSPAKRPDGGVLRWRCIDVTFSQKARAEARAAAINERMSA